MPLPHISDSGCRVEGLVIGFRAGSTRVRGLGFPGYKGTGFGFLKGSGCRVEGLVIGFGAGSTRARARGLGFSGVQGRGIGDWV